jgi:aspartate-semialdehyde dehydrogenase
MDVAIVFSALPSDVAGAIEENFTARGYLVSSNASNHRMDADVPLVIPEVNPGHLDLVRVQRVHRKSSGAIVCNGNCSTIHLTLALKPLADAFGLKRVIVTTMQALSGAGYPGVASLDILDNVIPFIGGEEPKLETEPLKSLGALKNDRVSNADIRISAACNRVATWEGHLEAVSVEFVQKPDIDQLRRVMLQFKGEPQDLGLPTAPARPIVVRDEPDRPQPRLDRDAEGGMASVIGRLRECNVLDFKFIVLGHNTLRGAAGSTLLNAELLVAKKFI